MESVIQDSMQEIVTEIQQHQNMVKQQLDAMRQELCSQMRLDKEALTVSISKQIVKMRPKRSRRILFVAVDIQEDVPRTAIISFVITR